MDFGIQTRGTYESVLEAALWAEQAGVVAFGLPDHYLSRGDHSAPAYDAYTQLAGLARETSQIALATIVSPVTFRHPAVLYKMGVSLDEMSDGRFTIGLGAGWMDEEFELFGIPYPDLKTRMAMYEEAMAYLRAAITPGSHTFFGEHYEIGDIDPHPLPINLRLMGGGAGKTKSQRITARYADEYNLYARPAEEYSSTRTATRAQASDFGRDPDEIKWTSASPALGATTEAGYQKLLEAFAEMTGQPADKIEATYEERQYPHGSGEKPAEMIAALEEAGCELFYLQMFAVERADYDDVLTAYRGR